MMIEISGLGGLLLLIADIWAIINVVQAPRSNGAKLLWILLILFLPVVGFLIWLFAGPRGSSAAPR